MNVAKPNQVNIQPNSNPQSLDIYFVILLHEMKHADLIVKWSSVCLDSKSTVLSTGLRNHNRVEKRKIFSFTVLFYLNFTHLADTLIQIYTVDFNFFLNIPLYSFTFAEAIHILHLSQGHNGSACESNLQPLELQAQCPNSSTRVLQYLTLNSCKLQ